MKKAIILHGMPDKKDYYNPKADSESNCHWLPWLQRQLIVKDVLAQCPEMPKPYEPDYASWKETFEQFLADEDTVLVGHSCGAGFIVRWLSENNVKVGKVVLVAPWINPEKLLKNDFFDFEIDTNLCKKTKGVTIFNSDNDYSFIHESVKILQNKIKNIKTVEFKGYGHFTLRAMGTHEFPELLKEVLS